MTKWTIWFELATANDSFDYDFVSSDSRVEEIERILEQHIKERVKDCEEMFRSLGLGQIIDDVKTYGNDLSLIFTAYDYEPVCAV